MVEKQNPNGAIAAIGNFDGVHRGHQFLLGETKKIAGAAGAPTAVIVFDPHPRRFFRPDDPAFLLTTAQDRDLLLREHGADIVTTLTFDAILAGLTPDAFVKDVLSGQLHLGGVVTGSEFRFGKGRAGDAAMLRALCEKEGVAAYQAPPLGQDGHGEKIGSSVVRQALIRGDVKSARQLLGRRWSVRGVVAQGQKLGRQIGFPTANLTLRELVEPKYGVYAVLVSHAGETHFGVANFGRRPTVGAPAPLLEAHLFDFDGDLYGETIEVAFADFIRPERKFDGVDALKQQIARDAITARGLFKI